ncbi:MAG: hypothetical protein IPH31_21560 [Lewinellaceae bacterium]|nr:hypothetical protein [Lewinellaceae bacterium]
MFGNAPGCRIQLFVLAANTVDTRSENRGDNASSGLKINTIMNTTVNVVQNFRASPLLRNVVGRDDGEFLKKDVGLQEWQLQWQYTKQWGSFSPRRILKRLEVTLF